MKRKLILLLVLVLLVSMTLVACSDKEDVDFVGVESSVFAKDLNILRSIVVEAMQKMDYNDEKMSKKLDKMNEYEYTKKLNEVELAYLGSITEQNKKLKEEFNSKKGLITSSTLDEINWLLQLTD